MTTINQSIKRGREKPYRREKVRAILDGAPFKSGVVTSLIPKLLIKKPNSAKRKGARVKLSNGKVITAYIPGEGHTLQVHSKVLVRGGGVKDCPGVLFKIVRGNRDCLGVAKRCSSRSKYGVKKV